MQYAVFLIKTNLRAQEEQKICNIYQLNILSNVHVHAPCKNKTPLLIFVTKFHKTWHTYVIFPRIAF